jgi:hypothetical protein
MFPFQSKLHTTWIQGRKQYEDSDEEEDISREENDNTRDNDEEGEDPPETQDLNMQPLPEENEKNTHRRTRRTFSTSVMCERTISFHWSFSWSLGT